MSELIGAAVFILLALNVGYYLGWKDGIKEGRRRTLHGQRLHFESHLAGRRSGVLR